MKRLLPLFFLLLFTVSRSFAQEEHALFTRALSGSVQEGVVDYRKICADQNFQDYMQWLAGTDPDALPSDSAKLAFWINAYNAWTLRIICDNYPLSSISELHTGGLILGTVLKTTVWDKQLATINGRKTSLNAIEHKILRPVFKDPRIHFAIVCAAKGCPPLRSEAYEAEGIDEQLDDQGFKFLAQRQKNRFDPDTGTAYISPIFGWFKQDFGSRPENVLRFIARYLPERERTVLSRDVPGWKIRYTDYDWSLNE